MAEAHNGHEATKLLETYFSTNEIKDALTRMCVRIIFVSHQWLAWARPDPDNRRYNCIVKGLKTVDAISCSVYIVRLVVDTDEPSNAGLLSQLGHQGSILYLTLLRSLHCDQAGKALLSCMQQAHVGTDAVEQLLWKHADPNATDVDGSTPLCADSELGHLEVVRCLCDVSAERNQAMTVGRTPLCIASH